MIKNEQYLQDMCDNIVEQVTIIQLDLMRNGETHYNYILEKLNRAKYDLDLFVELAQKCKEREEKKNE